MEIAIICLLIAALMHFLTKIPLALAMGKETGSYDNKEPRLQAAKLTGFGNRAMGAHANTIEAFPLFATGILLSMFTGVAQPTIDLLAMAFIAARVLYVFFYLQNIDMLRSIVWFVGYGVSLALIALPLFN